MASVAPETARSDPFRPARPGAGSLLLAGASLLWLPQAGLLAYAVQKMADGVAWAGLFQVTAWLLAAGLLRAGGEAWGLRLVFRAARATLSAQRHLVALALANRSPLDIERPASGLAASVIAEQAEAIVPYLTRYQPARLRAMLVPLSILAVVLPMSWIAGLILLCAAPLIPVFMALVGWRAKAASEAQMVEMGGMNAFLLDRLRGLATLRALGAVDATAIRLREAAQSLRRRTMAVLRIAFMSSAVLELFAALGVAMVAVYVGFHLLGQLGHGAWGARLSLGQGLFILLLAPAFFEPLRELSMVWHDRAAGEAALAAMARLAGSGRWLPGGADTRADTRAKLAARAARPPAVSVKGLRFTYPGAGAPVFDGFTLQVAPGEHVALTAPSGGGKTSLLSLIAGLAAGDAGRIAIDGVPLQDDSAAALRHRMAWLGQSPHVFAGDVSKNIALGRPGVTAADVKGALYFAALGGTAQAHGGTALGEGGIGLSGGEAVRLALARAVLQPHADLLLVDEPTAHLDTATAAEVTEALLQLAHGKTMLVATHDPVLAARLGRVVMLGATSPAVAEMSP